ncbi:hypothetical protein EWM64_g7229 [Hericium alpestre]|uniref:Uncharacterized protein n=1 Tax=Hericium alpestre TaxID=135208 RepID=A0A4Y9ZRW6_9AGAM|nr:hypothetical protein EWM64_g7229 [Hericium alpestre]
MHRARIVSVVIGSTFGLSTSPQTILFPKEEALPHGMAGLMLTSLPKYAAPNDTTECALPLGMKKLSSPRRSLSPQSSATYSTSEEEEEDLEGGKRRRVRKRSMESMPGSLPGSRPSFSEDEEELEFGHEDGYGHEAINEEAAEHAFDEDLFATGEMQNVPFL